MTVADLLAKIESYPKGFEFTLPYNKMTEKVREDTHKIMRLATDKGLVESIAIGAGWDADGTFNGFQNETFKRL